MALHRVRAIRSSTSQPRITYVLVKPANLTAAAGEGFLLKDVDESAGDHRLEARDGSRAILASDVFACVAAVDT